MSLFMKANQMCQRTGKFCMAKLLPNDLYEKVKVVYICSSKSLLSNSYWSADE